MKSRKLNSSTVLIFDTGDEVVSRLTQFAKQNNIAAAHFTAIGAFSDAGLGYFDLQKRDYLKNEVREQVEVVSLIGDIALDKGEPKVHAHVRPTLELVLEDSGEQLKRKYDPECGLALIDLG